MYAERIKSYLNPTRLVFSRLVWWLPRLEAHPDLTELSRYRSSRINKHPCGGWEHFYFCWEQTSERAAEFGEWRRVFEQRQYHLVKVPPSISCVNYFRHASECQEKERERERLRDLFFKQLACYLWYRRSSISASQVKYDTGTILSIW